MERWHYGVGGACRGPVGDAELRRLAATSTLRPTDLVWRTGMPNWVPAMRVKGLSPADRPPRSPDSPPPLPGHALPITDEPVHRWAAWELWVCLIVTLGLFALYLIPSWARRMARITRRPRWSFAGLLVIGLVTLGLALYVLIIKYAIDLTRHGRRIQHPDADPQLGKWAFFLVVVSFVWSLGTFGIGFLVGGFAMLVYATWLVQKELNKYFDDERASDERARSPRGG